MRKMVKTNNNKVIPMLEINNNNIIPIILEDQEEINELIADLLYNDKEYKTY